MNGNFRHPKFVKRYEYNYYDLETPLNAIVANNATQTKIIIDLKLIIHLKQTQLIGIRPIWKLSLNWLLLLIALLE